MQSKSYYHVSQWLLNSTVANGFTFVLLQWIITEAMQIRVNTLSCVFFLTNYYVYPSFQYISFLYLMATRNLLSSAGQESSIASIFYTKQWPSPFRHLDSFITRSVKSNIALNILDWVCYFRFCKAPAEAEAELALMSSQGMLDAVLTDDSDTLLFGVRTIIRKWVFRLEVIASLLIFLIIFNSWSIKKDKDTVRVYNVQSMPFERDDFILFGILLGGDYDNKVCNIPIHI